MTVLDVSQRLEKKVVPALHSTDLSIVIPVYNEQESIPTLCDALFSVLRKLGKSFEVICVDDGSSDQSLPILRRLAAERPELKIVSFRRNSGQTAALMAGIDHAEGEIIVSLDADLQNDPEDVAILLAKLDEGFDVVSGWRKDRKDGAIRRNLLSRIANRVISRISGVRLHDYGCTLKAYRREVVKDIRLYGEMHRFIPIYASWQGARVCEVPVRHQARKFGTSKYGLERVVKVMLDLLVVKFLDQYLAKPIYVFGGFGMISLAISILSLFAMLWLKLFDSVSMIQTPLPIFSAMTFLVGILSILMGVTAEILVRTYFESRDRRPYSVREEINFSERA